MMANQPSDVLLLRDAEAGYEAIGLRYYNVLEGEHDVESFKHLWASHVRAPHFPQHRRYGYWGGDKRGRGDDLA
jgi:hypothetical protein